jgi:iron complex transport system substrate-binding protein
LNQKLLLGVIIVAVVGFSAVGAYVFLSNEPETTDPEPEIPEEPETPEEPEPEPETQVITDDAGRNLTIPINIERVIAVDRHTLRTLTYLGASDLIIAVDNGVSDTTRVNNSPFLMVHPEYTELPSIGDRGGDAELIAAQNADVILMRINDVADLDVLQEQVGVPVIGLSFGSNAGPFNTFESRQQYYGSITLAGQVLHKEERAAEIINFFEECIADLDSRTADIPDSEKPSVYAAGHPSSLGGHGIGGTKACLAPFELTNAKNAITLEMTGGETEGILIDTELLLSLDPDMIFCDSFSLDHTKDDVQNNLDLYGNLTAIKNNQTYVWWPDAHGGWEMEIHVINFYFVGMTIYPDAFADVNLAEKGDEIFTFLLGQPLFDHMEEHLSAQGREFGFVDLLS